MDDEDHGGGERDVAGGGVDMKPVTEIVVDDCGNPVQSANPPTTCSTPKTFKAEKVEDEMVLGGSAEFRPIVGKNSSTSLSGLDTDFTKVSFSIV